jgi:hypothetical protein
MSKAASSQRGESWGRFFDMVRSSRRRPRGKSREAPSDRRRPIRRFRPALHPGAWLEPRKLLSAAIAPGAIGLPPPTRPAAGSSTGSATHATILQQPKATIILPPGLEPGRTYPLVVAFSYDGEPDANQYTPLKVWKTLGPKLGWIVYASKEYRNGAFYGDPSVLRDVARSIKAHIDAAIASLPVDRSRIILTGLSGAANFAEFFNLTYPGFAAAVIDNSGRIPFERFGAPTNPHVVPRPAPLSFGDARRIAVFLASPSDPMFYGLALHHDLPYYHSLGWQTLFLSFPGGHRNAPIPVYLEAIHWLESRPSWQ